ncbi:MAG: hypothetical protein ACRYFS_20325 [Janthinobacterium lividum]
MENQIQELQQQAGNTTGGERSRLNSQIANLQRQVREYQDPEKLRNKLIVQMGLDIDSSFMQSITRLFRHFTPDNFEVTIMPSCGSEGVVFRGILDRRLLRIQPEYLRVLYEGSVTKKWTMVGEVTHLPNISRSNKSSVGVSVEDTVLEEEPTQNDASIKDVMRKVVKSLADMEGTFFESKERVEVRLRPLAIYQEIQIQVKI